MCEWEDGVACERDLYSSIFRDLIRVGSEECAVDFLYKVFFDELPKKVLSGFFRDAEYLEWEREKILKREESLPMQKILGGFSESVHSGVRAFLFVDLAVNIDEQLDMRNIVFGKILVDRWLFVGYSLSRRCRALKLHKRKVLKEGLLACRDLQGFTGIYFFYYDFLLFLLLLQNCVFFLLGKLIDLMMANTTLQLAYSDVEEEERSPKKSSCLWKYVGKPLVRCCSLKKLSHPPVLAVPDGYSTS